MLVALSEHLGMRVLAADADRSCRHQCPGCSQQVVLKRGTLRVAHFAHRASVGCPYQAGETQAHLKAKLALAEALNARSLTASVEAEILSDVGDRRADVLLRAPDGRPIAIELQHSSISLEALARRTAAYIDAGVPVIWIAVLRPGALKSPKKIDGTNIVRVSRYPAPAWQRWIRGYHFGGPWFYDPVQNAMWRGHFSPAYLWEAGGHEGCGPPRRYASSRFRTLDLEGPYALSELRIARVPRPSSEKSGYCFPGGMMGRLVVQGERANDVPSPLPLRVIRQVSLQGTRHGRRVLEVNLDGAWQPACTRAVDLGRPL